MIWTYKKFHSYYENFLEKQTDTIDITFTEYKKINNKGKFEAFFYDSKQIHISPLYEMKSVYKYSDTFPKGVYVFKVHNDRLESKKRVYFLFPSSKVINKFSGETQLIADHYTFLKENNKKDKRPVKSHLTIYTPMDVVINKHINGFVTHIPFHLPKEITMENIDKHIKLDVSSYADCAKEILLMPLQEASGGGPSLRRRSNKTNQKTFASKNLETLLKKFYITEMTVIGIKSNDGKKYHHTTFIKTDNSDIDNSENENIEHSLPVARSFTFSLVGHKLEKKLIAIMKKWDDFYLHQ